MCRGCEGWTHADLYMCMTCQAHANTREGVEHGTGLPCDRPQVERHPDKDDNGNYDPPARGEYVILIRGVLTVVIFAFVNLVRHTYDTYVQPVLNEGVLWLFLALKGVPYPYDHILLLLIGIASLWFYESVLRRLVK